MEPSDFKLTVLSQLFFFNPQPLHHKRWVLKLKVTTPLSRLFLSRPKYCSQKHSKITVLFLTYSVYSFESPIFVKLLLSVQNFLIQIVLLTNLLRVPDLPDGRGQNRAFKDLCQNHVLIELIRILLLFIFIILQYFSDGLLLQTFMHSDIYLNRLTQTIAFMSQADC